MEKYPERKLFSDRVCTFSPLRGDLCDMFVYVKVFYIKISRRYIYTKSSSINDSKTMKLIL